MRKVKCTNNVAKRLETGLRNLKNTKNVEKTKATLFSRKHKLTDMIIEHLQYYFKVSLTRKVRASAHEMRDEMLSTL